MTKRSEVVGKAMKYQGKNKKDLGYTAAWCCKFVHDMYNQCGYGSLSGSTNKWSCGTTLNWFKANHPNWVDLDRSKCKMGDLVFMQFDAAKLKQGKPGHVGFFISPYSNTLMYTVEGNTSSNDKGSQDNGNVVAVKQRKHANVVAYVHIPYDM